ncbi:Histidine decarboxylase [Strongyloides ratti]|uniref:Aromatic-L-amino-acid decarboxylase n=1 Tax=Strongyloides ratti TaxID=34506 RepID=A0A090LSQ6_STRRB|nr:Histidine decarboxylase [Strongyloides ratti]CEF71217.1 Histidine decarboxylase [Strongyloides ratti]
MDANALKESFPKFVEAICDYLTTIKEETYLENCDNYYLIEKNYGDKILNCFMKRVFKSNEYINKHFFSTLFQVHIKQIVKYFSENFTFFKSENNLINIFNCFIKKIYFQNGNYQINFGNINKIYYNAKDVISYPSIVAEILMTAVGSPGFTWQASPLVTETELLMTDWIAYSLNIPKCFSNQYNKGNGAFHYTLEECLILSIVCAKNRKIRILSDKLIDNSNMIQLCKDDVLIGKPSYDQSSECYSYFSKHEPKYNKNLKGYFIGKVNYKLPKIFKDSGVQLEILENINKQLPELFIKTIQKDKGNFLFPFICIYSIDYNIIDSLIILENIISICKKYNIWITVNLSNVTGELLIKKYYKLNILLKNVDSIVSDIQSVFLTNEPCTILWLKNYKEAEDNLSITPTYLRHSNQGMIADLRHISFGFSKRPRGIRLWMIISTFGIEGLKNFYKYKYDKNLLIELINPLDIEEFKKAATAAFKFIIKYWQNINKNFLPTSNSPPMTISGILKSKPPKYGTSLENLIPIYEKLLEHTTHWLHPNFLAYFPCHTNYLCVLGDLFASAFGYRINDELINLEYETIQHIGKEMNLDEKFWKKENIDYRKWFYGSASEGTYKSVLMAREYVIKKFKNLYKLKENNLININILDNLEKDLLKYLDEWDIINDFNCYFLYNYLIAYTSEQAHSSVEKAYLLANVRIRKLPIYYDNKLSNFTIYNGGIEKAIFTDRKNGMIPFFITLPIGSTSTCGIDSPEIYAPISKKEGLWVHCDSAYLGGFFLLQEYQYILKGFSYVDSFVINLHKSSVINQDASMLFISNIYASLKELNSLGPNPRVNRSIKIWFLQKTFGFDMIRNIQRQQIKCAQFLESLLLSKDYLEVVTKQIAGLVCFKLKNCSNEDNEKLFKIINNIDRRIHITESHVNSIHFMRISINNPQMTYHDINFIFKVICENSEKFIKQKKLI